MADKLAKQCESDIYKQMPDLEQMVSMLQTFDQPEVVMKEGLFTVFRQMELEDAMEHLEEGDLAGGNSVGNERFQQMMN